MHIESPPFTGTELNEKFGITKLPNGFDEKKEIRKILVTKYAAIQNKKQWIGFGNDSSRVCYNSNSQLSQKEKTC